jgi:hypothetical protein
MAEKKVTTPDLVVLGREGYGKDWVLLFGARDAHKAAQEHRDKPHDTAFTKKVVGMFKEQELTLSAAEAKQLCVDYIRDHRSGGAGNEYRIKDRETGTILE